MNIVKFKDVILEGDDLFNTYLKGQYVYAINWQWLHPITPDFGNREYISASKNPLELTIRIGYTDYIDYIDMDETTRINDVKLFMYKNTQKTDIDITIEDVKKFRTNLAIWLWDYNLINENFDVKIRTMVNYYRQNMNDETTRILINIMGTTYSPVTVSTFVSSNTCGCGSTNVQQLQSSGSCNTLDTYVQAIHFIMFNTFSDYTFWLDKTEICQRMIKYLQTIINQNLPLTTETDVINCSTIHIDYQLRHQQQLQNVITALEYIVNDDINGNKNFITQALRGFAEMYDRLQW